MKFIGSGIIYSRIDYADVANSTWRDDIKSYEGNESR